YTSLVVTRRTPTGQRGLTVIVSTRARPAGRRYVSSRSWAMPRSNHADWSFSPQNRTAAWPVFETWTVPCALDPRTNHGREMRARSLRRRGPGTSRVTKDPIWLITLTAEPAGATGVTRKPTK